MTLGSTCFSTNVHLGDDVEFRGNLVEPARTGPAGYIEASVGGNEVSLNFPSPEVLDRFLAVAGYVRERMRHVEREIAARKACDARATPEATVSVVRPASSVARAKGDPA